MKIVISFDEETLLRYEARKSSPFFTIYWCDNDFAFPAEGWMDFGSIILGWWMMETKRIFTSNSFGTLYFMDGPYEIYINRNEDVVCLTIEKTKQSISMPAKTFVKELIQAATRVQDELFRLNIAEHERKALSAGIDLIKGFA